MFEYTCLKNRRNDNLLHRWRPWIEQLYKDLSTEIKMLDTFDNIFKASISVMLSLTVFGLVLIPTSSGVTCGLALTKKILLENILKKHKENKKNWESSTNF